MGYESMRIMFLFSLLFVHHAVSAQSESQSEPSELILGSWTYLTKTEGYRQTLEFYKDGTFEMKYQVAGKEDSQSNGTYEIRGEMLSLKFDSGNIQNNNIEQLDEDMLQIRYIENVFRYTRQDF